MRLESGTGTTKERTNHGSQMWSVQHMCRAEDHTARLTLCWLRAPRACLIGVLGRVTLFLTRALKLSVAVPQGWTGRLRRWAGTSPSLQEGEETAISHCALSAKTISGFIAGTDGWSSTAQSKSCTQVSAGGKEGQLQPLSAATCSDEKHDPLCCPAEKSKSTPATYQKSAQLCLPWKMSPALRCRERQERWQPPAWLGTGHVRAHGSLCPPLKTSSSPPSLPSVRNGNWRTFSSHSSLIFAHFQSHYRFLPVTLLGDKCGRSPARCFLDKPSDTS